MRIEVNGEVFLSEITPGDKPAYLKHFNATDLLHRRLLTPPYPYAEADADAWIAHAIAATPELQKCLNLAIRDGGGFLIGGCGLRGIERGHRAELGYWLALPYWNQGIMTATLPRFCDYGFRELGLVRIFAEVFANNPASARVLEKCGFQFEGLLRKHFRKDGEFLDAKVYALLKESAD